MIRMISGEMNMSEAKQEQIELIADNVTNFDLPIPNAIALKRLTSVANDSGQDGECVGFRLQKGDLVLEMVKVWK